MKTEPSRFNQIRLKTDKCLTVGELFVMDRVQACLFAAVVELYHVHEVECYKTTHSGHDIHNNAA